MGSILTPSILHWIWAKPLPIHELSRISGNAQVLEPLPPAEYAEVSTRLTSLSMTSINAPLPEALENWLWRVVTRSLLSCHRASYIDIAKRSCIEICQRDPSKRPRVKICRGDFAKRFCRTKDEASWKWFGMSFETWATCWVENVGTGLPGACCVHQPFSCGM